jgi:hypothetical protein
MFKFIKKLFADPRVLEIVERMSIQNKYRIMQHQINEKYFIEKYLEDFGWASLHSDNKFWLGETSNYLDFETIEKAEFWIKGLEAEEKYQDLKKNPKFIKYV